MAEIGTNPETQAITRAKDNIFAGRYSLPVQRGSPISKQVMTFNGEAETESEEPFTFEANVITEIFAA